MTLFDLRKKYVLLFDAVPDEIDSGMRKRILELLDIEIKINESRISQLEKERRGNPLDHNEHRLEELRGVIGK